LLLTIPPHIEQFQSLITIELSNNQLVQLPYELSLLKHLKNLYLKNNSLDDFSLPKELEQLKQLEVINLGGNRLKQFPYQLFQLINLKEIYLGSNQILFLPDLFQTLMK
jgi:Leucine-rich repeat (LRR) protein